jgi:spore coat polysaccharide biosynthesis protein SpsF (cytidylyltransferase family)
MGSKRLKNKNILPITKDNLNLIEVVIKRLKKCKLVNKIILAT